MYGEALSAVGVSRYFAYLVVFERAGVDCRGSLLMGEGNAAAGLGWKVPGRENQRRSEPVSGGEK